MPAVIALAPGPGPARIGFEIMRLLGGTILPEQVLTVSRLG